MAEDRYDRIRARAYALWDREGRPEGRARAHWEQAEREIEEEERGPASFEPGRSGKTEAAPPARRRAGHPAQGAPPAAKKAPGPPAGAGTGAGEAAPKRSPQGAPAGSPSPGEDNDPKRGGYSHADTAMGTSHSQMIADLEQTVTGSEPPRRAGSNPRKR